MAATQTECRQCGGGTGQLFACVCALPFFAAADRPRIRMKNGRWTLESGGCREVAKLKPALAYVQRKNRELKANSDA